MRLMFLLSLLFCSGITVASDNTHFMLEKFLQNSKIPGISISVAVPDQPIKTYVAGLSDIQKNIPIDKNTLFEFGSTMKTLTALAAFRIFDHHHLSFYTPVCQLLKGFKNAYAHQMLHLLQQHDGACLITTRSLLNHTSGMFDEQSISNYPRFMKQNRNVPFSYIMHIKHSLAHGSYPGLAHSFHYANVNYIFIGALLEAIEDAPFTKIIKKDVIHQEPMFYYYSVKQRAPFCNKLARAYRTPDTFTQYIFPGLPIVSLKTSHGSASFFDLTCKYNPAYDDGPAGGLITSTSTLAKWVLSRFTKAKTSKYVYQVMGRNQKLTAINSQFSPGMSFTPSGDIAYAYGIWHERLDNGIVAWQLIGEQWGYMGGAFYIPKQAKVTKAIAIAYAINTESAQLEKRLLPKLIPYIIKNS